jgi:hypothetical protein
VSAGLASLVRQQQRERQRVVALAARMRVVLVALSQAAGATAGAQRLVRDLLFVARCTVWGRCQDRLNMSTDYLQISCAI